MERRHSEQLQEALLRLERSRQQEKRLREESDAILRGLSELVGAGSQEEVLSILYTTFRQLVDCNHCWVMQEKDGRLVSEMSQISFPVYDCFSRVLDGGIVNAFDITRIPEWQAVETDNIRSALHLPLHLPMAKGMLILTHPSKIFPRDSVEIVQRVIPFAEQVTGKLELIRLGHERELEEQRTQSLESMRKLSRAIEQAGESIIITDHEGWIEYVNPAFTSITGYSKEEVLGKNPRLLQSGKEQPIFYEKLWGSITRGEVWHGRITDRRKDGSEYPASMTISPIMDDVGGITHYVGIQQDMSSHELLEEQLQQAQKMDALGRLVGGIAHDFNNMLAGISGNIFLAMDRCADQPVAIEKLENAEKLCFRAAEMIKQLLTFARKGAVVMKTFDLASFVNEVNRLSSASIPESIHYQCKVCSEELIVHGDTTQLQQAIMNLLVNARDAVEGMDSPAIQLEVESFQADQAFRQANPDATADRFAHLIVRDNGYGIGQDDLKHIFEPFFTTKEVSSGTGLGLSMVYGAVQSHKGIIDLKSEPGKGTTFHIYLPLESNKSAEICSGGSDEPLVGQGELILVVDDDGDVRSNSRAVLEHLGYRVVVAADGLQAVQRFAEEMHAIALVIMDVVMPRLGGVEAAERIRRLMPKTKIIFSTGYDKHESLQGEILSGESVVLTKPYNIVGLSRLIRQMLES